MASGEGKMASPSISPESLSLLAEGINLVLSRWSALQMAIRNEWGGKDSRRKSEDLSSTLLAFLSQSEAIEDGSVEEIAEQLMAVHEDCLQGNYESFEKLRRAIPATTDFAV